MNTIALTDEMVPRNRQCNVRRVISQSRPQSSAFRMSPPTDRTALHDNGWSVGDMATAGSAIMDMPQLYSLSEASPFSLIAIRLILSEQNNLGL